MGFALLSESLLVLVVAVLHANHAFGKPPYESQESVEETGRSFSEANIMPNQDVNETSVSRGSVDPSSTDEYLENYCPQERLRPSPPGHPCEAGSFKCHGYEEIVCNSIGSACLSSVPKFGTALCVPKYKWVTIDLGNNWKTQVRRTYACGCA